MLISIKTMHDGGPMKPPPPTSFSPVISTNVGISSQKFLNQDHPSKKWFFLSNPYKIEVITASPRNARVTKLWSHEHIYNVI